MFSIPHADRVEPDPPDYSVTWDEQRQYQQKTDFLSTAITVGTSALQATAQQMTPPRT